MIRNRESHAASEEIDAPYPPSWLDLLITWIDNLPGPPWLAYMLGLIFFGLFINLLFWVDGSKAIGYIDPLNTAFALFVIYWPLLYRYLSNVASRAFSTFRPLINETDAEVARMEYKITRLPRWLGWLSVLLGLALAIMDIIGDPAPYGDIVPQTILPYVGDVIITGFMAATFFALLIRSVRQLRMVSKLHSQASGIDLLDLGPAHAFSDLTSRTGMGVILVLLVSYPADPYAFRSAIDFVLYGATGLLAVAIFALPVMGIQNRIEEEKQRVLGRIHRRLDAARHQLHKLVVNNKYNDMGGIKDAIEALMLERDLIKGISTWPWEPRTIRGFASALLLPIFLGLVTRLFEVLL